MIKSSAIVQINRTSFGRYNKTYTSQKTSVEKELKNDAHFLSNRFNDFGVIKSISFTSIADLARRNAKYPEDKIYRDNIARSIGCKPEQLQSLMGVQELRDFLLNATPEDFSVGKEFKNVKEGRLRANLHMHTNDSDGLLKIEDLLNKSANYAKNMKHPPLLFAITNHDVLNDAKKAIKLIAANPDKYKNLRLVPGIELTAQYKNDEIFSEPVQLEILSYCVNPFDKGLNAFVDRLKDENLKYANEIVADLAKQGLKVDLEELKKTRRLFEIGASPAFLTRLKSFLLKKADLQGINPAIVHDRFDQHSKHYGNMLISKATPTIEEVGKNVQTGMLSIAHPGRYGFLAAQNDDGTDPLPGKINTYVLKQGVTPEEALKTFFSDFKANRGEAIEVNYDYTNMYDEPETHPWLLAIRKMATELDLLHGGGIDTHSRNIFKHKRESYI